MLLQGQGVTIERPARSAGTAIGLGASGVALALSLALLARGLGWPVSWPQFVAYAGAGVMLAVAATFAFWAYACATMRYIVEHGRHHHPLGPDPPPHPDHPHPADDPRPAAKSARASRGVSWFGYHVGRGEVGDEKRVLFFSTHRVPEDIVYIRTEDAIYAVSPQDTVALHHRLAEGVRGRRRATRRPGRWSSATSWPRTRSGPTASRSC